MAAVKVCKAGDLAPGMATRAMLDGTPVAIFNADGTYYALGDTCSHEEASLSEGELYPEDCEVECPKHGAVFNLETGQPRTLPATRPVPVFATKIVDGDLYVETKP